jgi:TetR/AcrR family transcriptional regulator, transcriptional repressor for nem operon
MEGIRAYFANLVDAIADGRRLRGCLLTNSLIELGDRDPVVSEKVILNMARLETTFAKAAGYLVCVVEGLNVLANTRPSRQTLEQIGAATLRAL